MSKNNPDDTRYTVIHSPADRHTIEEGTATADFVAEIGPPASTPDLQTLRARRSFYYTDAISQASSDINTTIHDSTINSIQSNTEQCQSATSITVPQKGVTEKAIRTPTVVSNYDISDTSFSRSKPADVDYAELVRIEDEHRRKQKQQIRDGLLDEIPVIGIQTATELVNEFDKHYKKEHDTAELILEGLGGDEFVEVY